MPRPVFGFSNKRVGTCVFLDDGTCLELVNGKWVEGIPLPRTPRAAETDPTLSLGSLAPRPMGTTRDD